MSTAAVNNGNARAATKVRRPSPDNPITWLELVAEMEELCVRSGLTFRFLSWNYLSRLLFALVWLASACYLNSLASVVAGYRTPWLEYRDPSRDRDELATRLLGRRTDRDSLPDFGHDCWHFALALFGHTTGYIDVGLDHALPDWLVFWASITTLAFTLLHPQRFMILRRVLFLLGILFFMRAITVTATQLPDASPTCQAQFTDPVRGAYKSQPMYPKALFRAWKVLWHPMTHVTCGDMVFSGHTTVLFLCHMIFRRYCKAKHLKVKVLYRAAHTPESVCAAARSISLVYAIGAALVIIGTRLHYTLDVLVAIFITCSVFNRYHSYLRYKKLSARGWFPGLFLLRWFEAEEMAEIEADACERAKRMH